MHDAGALETLCVVAGASELEVVDTFLGRQHWWRRGWRGRHVLS